MQSYFYKSVLNHPRDARAIHHGKRTARGNVCRLPPPRNPSTTQACSLQSQCDVNVGKIRTRATSLCRAATFTGSCAVALFASLHVLTSKRKGGELEERKPILLIDGIVLKAWLLMKPQAGNSTLLQRSVLLFPPRRIGSRCFPPPFLILYSG